MALREAEGPLTSHVLDGPVQHEVEQWVEALQDSTSLEKPPGREANGQECEVSTHPRAGVLGLPRHGQQASPAEARWPVQWAASPSAEDMGDTAAVHGAPGANETFWVDTAQ